MKRVLITGGTGTLGRAFIAAYREQYAFAVLSRGEAAQAALKAEYPEVECILGAVEDEYAVERAFAFGPDIVIHAAAMKHVDNAERQPAQAVAINVVGSLNVLLTAQAHGALTLIGISTDKACDPSNVYGSTKMLMERVFIEANSNGMRAACVRLGNIAGSNGSVIPRWKAMAAKGEALPVTDPEMFRFFCTPHAAAQTVQAAIVRCMHGGGFVMTCRLPVVRIGDLAEAISPNIRVVGARPGERLHECLAAEGERIEMADGTEVLGPWTTRDGPAATAGELREIVACG